MLYPKPRCLPERRGFGVYACALEQTRLHGKNQNSSAHEKAVPKDGFSAFKLVTLYFCARNFVAS